MDATIWYCLYLAYLLYMNRCGHGIQNQGMLGAIVIFFERVMQRDGGLSVFPLSTPLGTYKCEGIHMALQLLHLRSIKAFVFRPAPQSRAESGLPTP